jgi:hypothetical protein
MARAAGTIAVVVSMLVMNVMWWDTATATAVAPGVVVPYGANDYRYQQIVTGGGPAAFSDVDFDDSAFHVGDAPFGQVAGFDCPLEPTTGWSPNTDLLVRRTVSLPTGATDVVVRVAIDNDIELFWNGASVGVFQHDGCASYGSVEVAIPEVLLAAGDNVLAARASDRGGETFLDFEVTANLPPDCASVTTDTATLWPPNHDLHTVTAVGGSDPDGETVSLAVTSVTQDEPLDDSGDAATMPDADRDGQPANTVRLRAERSGNGDGRVYRLTVVATDSAGASCSTTLSIGVPHDRHGIPVDTTTVVVDSFGAPPLLAIGGLEPPPSNIERAAPDDASNALPARPESSLIAGADSTRVAAVASSGPVSNLMPLVEPAADPPYAATVAATVAATTTPEDKQRQAPATQSGRRNSPPASRHPNR